MEMQRTVAGDYEWVKCATAIAGVGLSAATVIVTFVPTAGLFSCLVAGTLYGLALDSFKTYC